jgi:hypothetical protein
MTLREVRHDHGKRTDTESLDERWMLSVELACSVHDGWIVLLRHISKLPNGLRRNFLRLLRRDCGS